MTHTMNISGKIYQNFILLSFMRVIAFDKHRNSLYFMGKFFFSFWHQFLPVSPKGSYLAWKHWETGYPCMSLCKALPDCNIAHMKAIFVLSFKYAVIICHSSCVKVSYRKFLVIRKQIVGLLKGNKEAIACSLIWFYGLTKLFHIEWSCKSDIIHLGTGKRWHDKMSCKSGF